MNYKLVNYQQKFGESFFLYALKTYNVQLYIFEFGGKYIEQVPT